MVQLNRSNLSFPPETAEKTGVTEADGDDDVSAAVLVTTEMWSNMRGSPKRREKQRLVQRTRTDVTESPAIKLARPNYNFMTKMNLNLMQFPSGEQI